MLLKIEEAWPHQGHDTMKFDHFSHVAFPEFPKQVSKPVFGLYSAKNSVPLNRYKKRKMMP